MRHGSERAHTALREQLEKAPKLLMHGTDYPPHAVLDYIVDGYAPLVDDIEEEVLEMEIQAADSFLDREQINHIFTLRRELSRLQRILGPMYEVALKLAGRTCPASNLTSAPISATSRTMSGVSSRASRRCATRLTRCSS